MRKTSPEAWMFAVFIIAIIIIPIFVGLGFFKVFRQIRPFPEVEQKTNSFNHLDNIQHDGFFKCTLVGWVICGPIFYLIYTLYLVPS